MSLTENITRFKVKPVYLKFFLNSQRKKSETKVPICLRIMTKGGKAELFIGEYLDPKDWDSVSQRAKGKKNQYNFLNHKLREIEVSANEIKWRLERERKAVTAKKIVEELKGDQSKDYTLIGFFELYIEQITAKTTEYVRGTIVNYRTTLTHLTEYLKRANKKHLLLKDFHRVHLDGFEQFLLTYNHPILKKPMNRNTANKYLGKLNSVLRNAVQKELISKSPFIGFTVKSAKVIRTILSDGEIQSLQDHPLGDNESLKKVRDVFVFSVYTGLRFSDAMNLQATRIKDENGKLWVTGYQIKTKEEIAIPMLAPAREIYERYELERIVTGYVLPRLSHQKVNTFIKTVASLVGINKRLSHHCARHTFATTVLLDKGVDIKTVSKWLGHYSIKSTEKYAKVSRSLLSNVADRIDEVYRKKATNKATT